MTKQKSTKRALLLSALSLLMCVSMLIGSTFAWFTDSVTSAGNTIQSGTLDVDLVDTEGNSLEGKVIKFVDLDENDLWEPGCTYKMQEVFVKNNGNLALKYEIVLNGIEGDAKLLEAIEWTINGKAIGDLTGTLQPGAQSAGLVLQGHMKETAGNEYQGLTVEGISIAVFATQLTSESDSFSDQYDATATFLNKDEDGAWVINNKDELIYFANSVNGGKTYTGETVKLTADIDLAGYKWMPIKGFEGTFDGQGHTISNMTVASASYAGFFGYAPIATIKNVKIDAAVVSGNHYAAGVVAHGVCTRIENCEVTNSTITLSTELVNGEWDNGDKAGAVVGYLSGEPTAYVKNCTVSNVTVKGYRDIGGIVGYANRTAEVSGNTISNSTVICDYSHNYKNYNTNDAFDVNDVIGECTTNVKVSNNTATNVVVAVPTAVKTVGTAAELLTALDNAVDGDVVVLTSNITDDVVATQKSGVNVTVEGNGYTFAGVFTVDGKSGTYTTAGLTIQNVNFVADSISYDACIRLGDGTNATRYTCNVTVKNCTFDVPDAVGIKSYTGGDKNLTISNCTATANTHSLVQAKDIDGILVQNCKVYSKNGMNFNNSTNVTIDGCTVDVKGYATRFGESSGGSGAAEVYLIKNCSLKSACEGGDAVIILRGTADYSTLTIENTTIEGSIEITNTADNTTVIK